MKLLRRLARLAAIPMLLGSCFAVIAAGSSAASAAPLATSAQHGWVRIAHLSPEAPAMDIYLYPFGDPAHPTVLRDVSYGDVSAYMALAPGQYTVAMRGFDAPATSHPALVSSFMVSAKTAYTVAALGPDPGLRVEVLQDQTTTPKGQALVRVVQASLKEDPRHGQLWVDAPRDAAGLQLGHPVHNGLAWRAFGDAHRVRWPASRSASRASTRSSWP